MQFATGRTLSWDFKRPCIECSEFRLMLLMHCKERDCTAHSKQIFPEMKLRGLVPNSFIFKWDYINRSQIHECGNWERGLAVSFLGVHKSDLVCSVFFPRLRDSTCRARIFKLLRSPRIDSKEPIPPGCVAWRAGTTNLFLLGS
jgi:hypothetical protein